MALTCAEMVNCCVQSIVFGAECKNDNLKLEKQSMKIIYVLEGAMLWRKVCKVH